MSLWTLLQAVLLFVNGLAILNNERFLEPYGWGFKDMTGGGHSLDSNRPGALKQQTIGLLHAIAYLRVPLIVTNALVIFVKLLFG
ncbi:hypothetical protein CVIRNUC_000905 [Coccomyxa viridis]|uniref:Immediate early response 3-interacting protein 1 n=1 Tax=Coccomyxa viridis TaxID=1274662 RepID=A0AAV1HRP8_9CHLO|nr:hypothetical protein CVIRNUC_000905 [Coccomyxa viridis]